MQEARSPIITITSRQSADEPMKPCRKRKVGEERPPEVS
jgi:hypothetical protein